MTTLRCPGTVTESAYRGSDWHRPRVDERLRKVSPVIGRFACVLSFRQPFEGGNFHRSRLYAASMQVAHDEVELAGAAGERLRGNDFACQLPAVGGAGPGHTAHRFARRCPFHLLP